MKKDDDTKRTKLARILFERGISLTELNQATGVSYPTLENLKFGRPLNYRHRTLRDVASYLDITISELLEDNVEVDYNSPFERAIAALCKRNNLAITLQDIHEATGVSLPILTSLKKGGKANYRKRTIRDIAEYLGISEEELLGCETKKPARKNGKTKAKDGIAE